MRITCDTDDRLVIESSPWVYVGVCAAFIVFFVSRAIQNAADGAFMDATVVLFGGGGLALLGVIWVTGRSKVTLDKANGTVERTGWDLYGTYKWIDTLDDVQKAAIEENWESDDPTYCPVLLTSSADGEDWTLPLSSISTNAIPIDIVERVNNWLGRDLPVEYVRRKAHFQMLDIVEESDRRLVIQNGSSSFLEPLLFFVAFLAIFLAIASSVDIPDLLALFDPSAFSLLPLFGIAGCVFAIGALLFRPEGVTLIFDRHDGTLTVKHHGLFPTPRKRLDLAEVDRVEAVDTAPDTLRRLLRWSGMVVRTTGRGKDLALTHIRVSTRPRDRNIAKAINGWLRRTRP